MHISDWNFWTSINVLPKYITESPIDLKSLRHYDIKFGASRSKYAVTIGHAELSML